MTALLQEHFFLNDSNHTLDMADSVSDSVSLSSFDNASTHSNSKATGPEDKKVRATTKKKRNRKEQALEQQEQQRQDHEPHALPLHATTRRRISSNNEDDNDDSIYELSIRPDPEFGFGLKLGCVLKGVKRVTIIHSLQKHPRGSHRLLPAEATGKLRLMDQLLAVNGVNVESEAFQIICGHIRLLGMGLKTRPSEFLTLRFKKHEPSPAAAAAAVATNVAVAATNTINKEKQQHSSATFQSPNSIANHTFADDSNSSREGKNKNNNSSSSSNARIFRRPDSIQIVKKRGSISSIDEPAPKPDSINILVTNRRGSISSLEETSASKLVFKPASLPSTSRKRRRPSSSSWPLPRRHVSLNSTASKKAPPTAVVTAATLPKKRTRSNTTAATAATTDASAVATTAAAAAAAATSKNKDQNDNTTHPPEDDFEPWSIDHEHNHDDHDDDEEGNWKTTGLVDP